MTIVPDKLQLSECLSALLTNIDHESVHLAAPRKGEHIACKVHRDNFSSNFTAGTGEREDSRGSVFVASRVAEDTKCWIDSCVGWKGEAVDFVSYLGREASDNRGGR